MMLQKYMETFDLLRILLFVFFCEWRDAGNVGCWIELIGMYQNVMRWNSLENYYFICSAQTQCANTKINATWDVNCPWPFARENDTTMLTQFNCYSYAHPWRIMMIGIGWKILKYLRKTTFYRICTIPNFPVVLGLIAKIPEEKSHLLFADH